MLQPAFKPLRILVVDDDVDSAQSFAILLDKLGHEALFLTDPMGAATLARRTVPQLIFLDIGMPGIDGWELARMLRKRLGEDVRLVAITGHGTSADRKRSRQAGFDAHVQKRIDIELLKSTLAQISCSLR